MDFCWVLTLVPSCTCYAVHAISGDLGRRVQKMGKVSTPLPKPSDVPDRSYRLPAANAGSFRNRTGTLK